MLERRRGHAHVHAKAGETIAFHERAVQIASLSRPIIVLDANRQARLFVEIYHRAVKRELAARGIRMNQLDARATPCVIFVLGATDPRPVPLALCFPLLSQTVAEIADV